MTPALWWYTLHLQLLLSLAPSTQRDGAFSLLTRASTAFTAFVGIRPTGWAKSRGRAWSGTGGGCAKVGKACSVRQERSPHLDCFAVVSNPPGRIAELHRH